MTKRKISAGRAEDLLGYIPHALGFQPRESLVFLTLQGNHVGATLRLDLPVDPPGIGLRHRCDYAGAVAGYLESDTRATGSLMVMYTDGPIIDPAEPPHRELVECVSEALDAAGVPLRDGWLVSAGHWRDYFCTSEECCPLPGWPRGSIDGSRVSAEMVFRGSSFAPSSADAVAARQFDGTADPDHRAAIAAAAGRATARIGGGWLDYGEFSRALGSWDRLLCGTAADLEGLCRSPEAAGYLLAGLACRGIRDSLLVLAAAGPAAAVRGAVASGLVCAPEDSAAEHPADADADADADTGAGADAAAFAALLLGDSAGPPSWARLDALDLLCRRLVPLAQGEARAALWTLLAWIEWARGRGSWGHWYLKRCLAESPGYRLARLLTELLEAGAVPRWARNPRTAWSGRPRDAA